MRPASYEVNECHKAYPRHYIKLNAYDAHYSRHSTALSFIVNRPAVEPDFSWTSKPGRLIRFTIHPLRSTSRRVTGTSHDRSAAQQARIRDGRARPPPGGQ